MGTDPSPLCGGWFMNGVPFLHLAPPLRLEGVGDGDRTGGEMRELGGQDTNFYLDSLHFLSCGPHSPSPRSPSSSVLLLGSAVLRNALGGQFGQHIIQVIGIWVAMASEVGAKLRLVVHLIPDNGVRLARSAGSPDGENEAAVPGHKQQLQNL